MVLGNFLLLLLLLYSCVHRKFIERVFYVARFAIHKYTSLEYNIFVKWLRFSFVFNIIYFNGFFLGWLSPSIETERELIETMYVLHPKLVSNAHNLSSYSNMHGIFNWSSTSFIRIWKMRFLFNENPEAKTKSLAFDTNINSFEQTFANSRKWNQA